MLHQLRAARKDQPRDVEARQFVNQLLGLGAKPGWLVVKSRQGAPRLGRLVPDLNLQSLALKARQEPVQHRLQIIDREVVAEEAAGRQVDLDDEGVSIKVQLRMLASSKPTFRDLRDRARERLDVVAAGQRDLAFLEEEERLLDMNNDLALSMSRYNRVESLCS